MHNLQLVRRAKYLTPVVNFVKRPRQKDRHMIIVGEAGAGKTTLVEEVVNNQLQELKQIIAVPFTFRGDSPLTVQLVRLEDAVRRALIERGHESVLRKTGSYLAHRLYGDVRFVYEPRMDVDDEPPIGTTGTTAPREIIEISERYKMTDILESYSRWLQMVTEAITPDKLVIFIDTSQVSAINDLANLLGHFMHGKEPNVSLVVALDSEVLDRVVDQSGISISDQLLLHLEPFDKLEAREAVGKMHTPYSVRVHDSEQIDRSNNPLDTYVNAVAAGYSGRFEIGTRQEAYRRIVEGLGPSYVPLHQVLAVANRPLSISVVADLIRGGRVQTKEMALGSPLVRILNQGSEDLEVRLFHSSAARWLLENTDLETKQRLAESLAQLYRPDGFAGSEYRFYALHPENLIVRLNLLREAASREYVSMLTSAAVRALFRQWATTRYAVEHIRSALEEHGERLAPAQRAVLCLDAGYFLRSLGNDLEAEEFYEEAIRITETDADNVSQKTAKIAIQQAEALLEQADFFRKQGNYEQAVDALKKARLHYETLLEVVIPSRVALELEIAQVTHNLGIVLRDYAGTFPPGSVEANNLLRKALGCFEEAYAVEELHQSVAGQIAALSQVVLANAHLRAYEETDRAFRLMYELCQEAGDLRSAANTAGNLAVCFLAEGTIRPHAAERYALMAASLFRDIGDGEQEMKAQNLLDSAAGHVPADG